MTPYSHALHAHLHKFFAGHESGVRRWEGGKAWNFVDDFHVVEVAPGPRTDRWTYVSVGCGTKEPENGRRVEFVLCAREPSERHIALVEVTAFYHLNGQTLDVGHTMPIGEPWLFGAIADHMLVTLPYPFGKDLEVFIDGEFHAHVLWLVPITKGEAQLRHEKGLDALESKFESSGMDYSDPLRRAVDVDERVPWWRRW